MKYLSFILIILISVACQQAPRQSVNNETVTTFSSGTFGKEFPAEKAIAAADLIAIFNASDTVETTISGSIINSCKHSGCWMDLDMGNSETIHVTFLDESFTIPLDAAGKNAIAQGTAIRELITVETLQNYAREEGKSDEEVTAITDPVYTYEFIAKGVLIEE